MDTLAKMSPSKTDTWRTILLKIRTVRLFTPKKKNNTLTYIKKIKPLTHQKTEKKEKKKKTNPKTQTVVPDQDSE